MRNSSFSKLALLLPMIAFALASCNDEQEPYLGADLWGYATQIEAPVGSGEFIYVPDLRAVTYSTSSIMGWNLKKNETLFSPPGYSSPFRDAYESWILPTYYFSHPSEMNGTYSFDAKNTEGNTVMKSFGWNFLAPPGPGSPELTNYYRPFTESWGENEDVNERDEATHYASFSYDGSTGWVQTRIKPFTNEGIEIAYAIMYARYEKTNLWIEGHNPVTNPNSFRLSRVAGNFSEPYTPPSSTSGTEIPMTLLIQNISENDYAQVALVAFKPVRNGSGGVAGTVMMRTEFKTIRNGMNTFMEDAEF